MGYRQFLDENSKWKTAWLWIWLGNINFLSIVVAFIREYKEKETSLLIHNPMLAQEWNYEKNGKLTPASVMPSSNKKVWWKCQKNHEWQTTINSRNSGVGCPYCSNKKVLIGYNDLQTINPKLAKEWNDEKNGDLTPKQFTAKSGKKVWWKCEKGHEWQADIYSRNKGTGCPQCAKEKRKELKNT